MKTPFNPSLVRPQNSRAAQLSVEKRFERAARKLGRGIDLGTPDTLHPALKDDILRGVLHVAYLKDMLDSVREIIRYVEGLAYQESFSYCPLLERLQAGVDGENHHQ